MLTIYQPNSKYQMLMAQCKPGLSGDPTKIEVRVGAVVVRTFNVPAVAPQIIAGYKTWKFYDPLGSANWFYVQLQPDGTLVVNASVAGTFPPVNYLTGTAVIAVTGAGTASHSLSFSNADFGIWN